MHAKKVLVVSHAADGTAQFLIKRLEEIGQPYHLLDLGLFPSNAKASLTYDNELTGSLIIESGIISLDEIKSVWWRRPRGKIKRLTTKPIEHYIEMETDIFLNGFCLLLPNIRWVSNPEKTRIANNKPLQLKVAKSIGFKIPKTLISNDPVAVKLFIESTADQPLIMKPVGTSFVRMSLDPEDTSVDNLAIFTKILDRKEILNNIELVQNCPVIFQEAIIQAFDIRVTVIGSEVFAAKITHSVDSGDPRNLDWRNHKLDRIYEPYTLPSDISDKCIQLVISLGLNMGAIDLCFSKEKGYVFLEINPQGQWIPSETLAGLPISVSLAHLLAEC